MKLFLLTELESHFIEEHGLKPEQLAHIRKLCQSNSVSYFQILEGNDAKLHVSQPTAVELAWLAGLYEGEGCMVRKCDKRNDRVSWELSISSIDEDVVRRCRAITGMGSVDFIKRQKEHWSDQYRWRVSRREHLARIMLGIEDQLGIRRGLRVQEFLSWYKEVTPNWEVDRYGGKSKAARRLLEELQPTDPQEKPEESEEPPA